MHPRESIPNVGRRANGRKALFLLKGNSIDSTGTKLSVPRIDLSPDNDTATSRGGNIPVNVPRHPYNNILQRIMHRHQETHANQVKAKVPDLAPGQKVTPRGFGRETDSFTGREYANANADVEVQLQLRRLGVDSPGYPSAAGVNGDHRSLYRPRDSHPGNDSVSSHKQGYHADDRGCFRERVQRRKGLWLRSVPEKKGTPDSIGSMTSRSEGSDSLRFSREGGDPSLRLPQATQRPDPGALEEILDYFWVYQGMGRQVLNLDLAGASWERKLFRKCQQLPPIARSYDQQQASVTPSPGRDTGACASTDDDTMEKKRVQSEPPMVGRSLFRDRFRGTHFEEESMGGGENRQREYNCDKETQLSQPVMDDQRGKIKLVIKMPVLTRDVTRADSMIEYD
ncbi:hypothetical protein BaRGS_00015424 [Batillaria attramentaria]|uniref:Uncharacterized protein n=1 Tax=Batillaria attramentaria TaxID=370345 RepID=A0ABD0L191_9CAEN